MRRIIFNSLLLTLLIAQSIVIFARAGEVIPEPLGLMSNCAYAYGYAPVPSPYSATPKSIFKLQDIEHGRVTVEAVNVGFPGTGTAQVADDNEEKLGNGCHGENCKGTVTDVRNPLVAHFHIINDCIRGESADSCSTTKWQDQARDMLLDLTVTGAKHLGADPMQYCFSELRHLLPDATIQHSLQDPFIWVLDRISKHDGKDLMCADQAKSSNPFHILECMDGSKNLQDNLVTIASYTGLNADAVNQYISIAKAGADLTSWRSKYPGAEIQMRKVADNFAIYNAFILTNSVQAKYEVVCTSD